MDFRKLDEISRLVALCIILVWIGVTGVLVIGAFVTGPAATIGLFQEWVSSTKKIIILVSVYHFGRPLLKGIRKDVLKDLWGKDKSDDSDKDD